MSVRSELRAAALERDGHMCQWPRCGDTTTRDLHRLEMAHLIQLSQGGPDTLDNVVILCRWDHSVLDSRLSWKEARPRVVMLFGAFLQATGYPTDRPGGTPPATDTLSSGGRSEPDATRKPLNTASSTDISLPPATSTTSTATPPTTEPTTSQVLPPSNTARHTATSTTTLPGLSIEGGCRQSLSGGSSDVPRQPSPGDSGNEATISATREQDAGWSLTETGSLRCSWPGCHPDASVPSSVSPMYLFAESSATLGYRPADPVALCPFHSTVLDNRVVRGRRSATVDLLRAYLHHAGWESP